VTARELCNYLIAVASGDYEVRIAEFNDGSNIIFTKFIEGTQLYDPNIRTTYDVYHSKTCMDLVHFITRNNLENYAVVSPVRLWRVVNYMDISIDPVRREVVFR
jgi:hypothetical protein